MEEMFEEEFQLDDLLNGPMPEQEIVQENVSEPHYKPKRARFMLSKPTYYALIVIFALVFVLCGIYLGGYILETEDAENQYDMINSIFQQGMVENPTNPPVQNSGTAGGANASGPAQTQPPVMLPEMKPIYKLNNDLVEYLHFPNGPSINYPVVQSPYDEDFYLDHQFDRSPNGQVAVGCPYVPLSCDVFEPSDNVVIYGHYLQDGGMFGKLPWFREKSYWESHQTFRFDTLYERHTYKIFAVFKTAAAQYTEDGDIWGYPYNRINDFDSKESFDKFIEDVKGAAFTTGGYQGYTFYDTGITPEYGDKLLCLSTCEYTMKDPNGKTNGRLVVMAVRID